MKSASVRLREISGSFCEATASIALRSNFLQCRSRSVVHQCGSIRTGWPLICLHIYDALMSFNFNMIRGTGEGTVFLKLCQEWSSKSKISSIANGIESRTNEEETSEETLAARSPARPWNHAAAPAASTRSFPFAERAAIMPDRTSPVPAVARASVPLLLMRTGKEEDAMRVGEPFRRMTAPYLPEN